ncbi:hypothetical protein TNCV_1715181, partial [Trichonephila clavipes]
YVYAQRPPPRGRTARFQTSDKSGNGELTRPDVTEGGMPHSRIRIFQFRCHRLDGPRDRYTRDFKYPHNQKFMHGMLCHGETEEDVRYLQRLGCNICPPGTSVSGMP